MNQYDVCLSLEYRLVGRTRNLILNDRYKFRTICANSTEEAIKIACKLEKEKGNKVNYILSCQPT